MPVESGTKRCSLIVWCEVSLNETIRMRL